MECDDFDDPPEMEDENHGDAGHDLFGQISTCPMCDGEEVNVLGLMGNSIWCRCCLCGWDFNPKAYD